MGIITFLSKLIAPPYCIQCRIFTEDYEVLCVSCKLLLKPITSQLLKVGSKKISVFAVSEYKEPLVGLIRAKNYNNPVASKQLAQLIWQMTSLKHQKFDVITPVPLHWLRRMWRGFNQADIMARELSNVSNIPTMQLADRIVYTNFQASLKKHERQKNMQDTFVLAPNAYQYTGKHILIVDDVMTTGSTLQAFAKTLMRVKPASVTAVVAARVLD